MELCENTPKNQLELCEILGCFIWVKCEITPDL